MPTSFPIETSNPTFNNIKGLNYCFPYHYYSTLLTRIGVTYLGDPFSLNEIQDPEFLNFAIENYSEMLYACFIKVG